LGEEVQAGDVVFILYEGPKGGPGMQEMLYPTSYIKSVKLDKACALVTDGRFSGGTSGLVNRTRFARSCCWWCNWLVRNGDKIEIDIPARKINLLISEAEELNNAVPKNWQKATMAFKPNRERVVSKALKAYANLVSSSDKGDVQGIMINLLRLKCKMTKL
jgi:dihydroxy-acid dehydratase